MWKTLIQLSILTFIYSLYTLVFIFWSIYLIDAVKRKRIYYKRTLRCLQREDDLHQQALAYNARTELVKYSFLFCINLVEWFACTFGLIPTAIPLISEFHNKTPTMNTSSDSEYSTDAIFPVTKRFHLNLPNLDILCMILSMILIGSLCMYLSARYAHKSWIKSNSIPYWICFFVLSSTLTQFLVSICYTSVIGVWCEYILFTLSIIFAWKQYRKLCMVMNWTIVDLQVSGRKRLFLKHKKMKRTFTRIFTIIWISVLFFLTCIFTTSIFQTFLTFSLTHDDSFFLSLLSCVNLAITTHGHVNAIIIRIELTLGTVGALMLFIPYICFGFVTMCVTLWRLCKGTTGYRTHFHNRLYDPLIT